VYVREFKFFTFEISFDICIMFFGPCWVEPALINPQIRQVWCLGDVEVSKIH
jgi:hypothetical protein